MWFQWSILYVDQTGTSISFLGSTFFKLYCTTRILHPWDLLMNLHCFGLSLALPHLLLWAVSSPSPLPPSSLTSTQFSVETQVYETVIKMNTLGLQSVRNRLSAQASSPSLALALHHRIVSFGILSRRPTQRGARAGQLHSLWHYQPVYYHVILFKWHKILEFLKKKLFLLLNC